MNSEQGNVVSELETQGLVFDVIPENVHQGMKYTTPRDLVQSGITKLTIHGILRLLREGIVPSFKLAGRIVLSAEGVKKLLEYEALSFERVVRRGGRSPGWRKENRD